jgi:hypothetical protein
MCIHTRRRNSYATQLPQLCEMITYGTSSFCTEHTAYKGEPVIGDMPRP